MFACSDSDSDRLGRLMILFQGIEDSQHGWGSHFHRPRLQISDREREREREKVKFALTGGRAAPKRNTLRLMYLRANRAVLCGALVALER